MSDWRTVGGFTREVVERSHHSRVFPQESVLAMLDAADAAHHDAMYAENDKGGEARHVVAVVARRLAVDIDAGPGHRWDRDHMARVITAADAVVKERDEARKDAVYFQEWAERNGTRLNEALRQLAEQGTDNVDELRATIVRQANEITALKGERQ